MFKMLLYFLLCFFGLLWCIMLLVSYLCHSLVNHACMCVVISGDHAISPEIC
jgi:hypothetical protein